MNKDVLICVPSYNEEECITKTLEGLRESFPEIPVIVVDDGSHDKTFQMARSTGVEVIRHPVNLGQSGAIRTGFKYALLEGFDIVVTFDADLQHSPKDLPAILEPLLEGRAEVVLGSRFIGSHEGLPRHRLMGIRFLSKLISWIVRLRITDCTNGFRGYDMRIVQKMLPYLRENQYGGLELLVEAHRQGARIVEVPVVVSARAGGKTKKGAIKYIFNLLRSILR